MCLAAIEIASISRPKASDNFAPKVSGAPLSCSLLFAPSSAPSKSKCSSQSLAAYFTPARSVQQQQQQQQWRWQARRAVGSATTSGGRRSNVSLAGRHKDIQLASCCRARNPSTKGHPNPIQFIPFHLRVSCP